MISGCKDTLRRKPCSLRMAECWRVLLKLGVVRVVSRSLPCRLDVIGVRAREDQGGENER